MTDLVNEIWLVICTAAQQRERLQKRDPDLSPADLQNRLLSQWPLSQKIPQADRVIDNSGSPLDLPKQVIAALGHLGSD